MASSGITREATTTDDDELKSGEAKVRRKFKPFDAVRKLFSKNRRKNKEEQVSVVAVKAKSTTALHHGDDDEDDDGGFKKKRPLGGKRSISEDSVFSPEQKETSLQTLKKTAVSEESLPKSAFQAELFSKLKRRSNYSDEDDGLPHSPTPPVTTADIIMGGHLKSVPGVRKSTSRESDNSLISVDSSDNEEEDPFQNKWKSSVPSKAFASPGTSAGAHGPIDFSSMEQTVLLKSNLAKDRISVAPKLRKATRQSRKKRDAHSPHSLPSLNEESPTKAPGGHSSPSPGPPVVEDKSVVEVSLSSSDSHKVTLLEKASSPDGGKPSLTMKLSDPGPVAEKPKSATPGHTPAHTPVRPSSAEPVLEEVEKHASLKSDSKDVAVPARTSSETNKIEAVNDPAGKETAAKAPEVVKKDSETPTSGSASLISKWQPAAAVSQLADSSLKAAEASSRPKSEGLASSTKSTSSQGSESSAGHREGEVTLSARITIKGTSVTTITTAEPAVNAPVGASASAPLSQSEVAGSPVEGRKDGLRPTDSHSSPAFSHKDDYKLKRQSRSKTLQEPPVAKEEQFATKVQRAASHRVDPTGSQNTSPDASPRLGSTAAETPKSKEPAWFELARKKTCRQDSDEKKESPVSPAKEVPTSRIGAAATPATEAAVTATSSSKTEAAVSTFVDSTSNISVSSAFSKFESKQSEVSRVRGGSVKTSPTKTNLLSARGGSIKVNPGKAELAPGPLPSGAAQSLLPRGTTMSSASSTTAAVAPAAAVLPASKADETKVAEPAPVPAPAKETPKWKTQSIKSPHSVPASTPANSSSLSVSRFGGVKTATTQPQHVPASVIPAVTPAVAPSVTPTVTSKREASPDKKQSLTKTLSDDKEKNIAAAAAPGHSTSSVPAWRANLGQKKSVGLDPGGLKIELIESTPSPAGKKPEPAKPPESPMKLTSTGGKELQPEQCRGLSTTSRTSKVMNLLKNFENIQGVS